MGVRILTDKYDETAVLYCSTSDWAFGPVFYKDDFKIDDQKYVCINASTFAETFLKWLGRDPRIIDDISLEEKYHEFRRLNWKQCPTCLINLITEDERVCEGCLMDEEEAKNEE